MHKNTHTCALAYTSAYAHRDMYTYTMERRGVENGRSIEEFRQP